MHALYYSFLLHSNVQSQYTQSLSIFTTDIERSHKPHSHGNKIRMYLGCSWKPNDNLNKYIVQEKLNKTVYIQIRRIYI